MSKLRVLEAITPSRIGGAEVYVADLSDGLNRLGAQVELFCPAGRPFVDYAASRGLDCITWKTHGKIDPLTVIRLAKLIKATGADVLHTHLSTASLLGAFAARLAGKPSVAHVHGLNSAACFKHSGTVIAVSEAAKEHLVAQGLPADRVRVVHNGVDLAKYTPMPAAEAKRETGLDADTRWIGVFGRLSPEKGQKLALEAFELLAKTLPDVKLLVVGDGKDREELISLADSLAIADRVRFEGFDPDIRALMAACDAVLIPSLKEGFGLVAVNAMALQRPVIAASVGGLPEIVTNGQTGLLVPPGDPQAFAAALTDLLGNPDQMESMGKLGRKRAEESFDLDRQIGQVLKVLESVAR